MRDSWRSKKQRGVAAIIVGLSLFVLMGFAGLVIDVGRLFVTKTELQSAVDACALAGARFLNSPTKSQLEIAASVGKSVGELNKAIFQAETAVITNVDFSDAIDGEYGPATEVDLSGAQNMRYIRCEAEKTSILNAFMRLFGFETSAVAAVAKASLVGGGSNCMLPVAMCRAEKEGSPLAFVPGKWYEGRISATGGGPTPVNGSFRWIKFPSDSNGASSFIDRLLADSCQQIGANTQVNSEPGQIASIDTAFNTKFGVYQNPYNLTDNPRAIPDPVGYAYLEPDFASGAGSGSRAYDQYKTDLVSNTPYQSPPSINFNPTPGIDPNLGTSNSAGVQRRLLLLPVVDCDPLGGGGSSPVLEMACMLALHPIGQNKSEVNSGEERQPITNGNVDCKQSLSGDLECKSWNVELPPVAGEGNCNCSNYSNGRCDSEPVCYTGGKKDITNLMRMEYIDDGGAGSACSTLGAPGTGFAKVPGLVQ